MKQPFSEQPSEATDLDPELLGDLQRQTKDAIDKLRSHERIEARLKVILQPGNSSDRLKLKIQGFTQDISKGGCRAVFPLPLTPGDIYRLEFDQSADLPLIFARCMRSRVLREDAYEAGFRFFTEITLPGAEPQKTGVLD